MTTHAIEKGAGVHAHLSTAARRHLAWLLGGLAIGFLVPFVFADTLDLPRDLFYAVYVVSVVRSSCCGRRQRGKHLARCSAVAGCWHSPSGWPRRPSFS
jgi:hypothetical protein